MTREEAEDRVRDTPALFADGFDDCILGVCHGAIADPVIAYDQPGIIAKLMNQGLSRLDAEEYFAFNILGAYVGPGTPVFIETGEVIRTGAEILKR